jgi:hypothetical protein
MDSIRIAERHEMSVYRFIKIDEKFILLEKKKEKHDEHSAAH